MNAHGLDPDDAAHVDDLPASEGEALLGTLVATLDAVALASPIETATGAFLVELGRDDPDLAGRLAEPLRLTSGSPASTRRSAHADLARLRHRARPLPLGAACAYRNQSKGSGGSASHIVIGRSVVAGLSLSPRPDSPSLTATMPAPKAASQPLAFA